MTYPEFQALIDAYTDGISSYVLRKERNRPEQVQLDALRAAVKAKDALWDAIRGADQPDGGV